MGRGGLFADGVRAQDLQPALIGRLGEVDAVSALLRAQRAVIACKGGVEIHQVDLFLRGQLGDEGIVGLYLVIGEISMAGRFSAVTGRRVCK